MRRFRQTAAAAAAALLLPLTAAALQSGDDAIELKAEFLANGPVALTPADRSAAKPDDPRHFKVLLIVRAEATASPEALAMAHDLSCRYPDAKFIVLSPDPERPTRALFDRFRQTPLALARDAGGESTRKYMAGSALYPAAFVIGADGRIRWDGEAIDLPEVLERIAAGTFDDKQQRRIAPLLLDLQSRMRSGEDRMAEYTMRRILELDPANAAALRLRLFMLENTGRAADARTLLEEQLARRPAERRLYLMQLDLASRGGDDAGRPAAIAGAYLARTAPAAAADAAMAWMLLNRAPFDPAALEAAGGLCARARQAIGENTGAAAAEVHNASALCEARTGRLAAALEAQRRATAVLRKFAPHRVAASERLERYYETALRLGARTSEPAR